MPQQPPRPPDRQWWVYIIRNRNGDLYTGITTDPQRRLAEHRGTTGKGAKSLRGKAPLQIVWRRRTAHRSAASRIEHRIKQLSKAQKENLIAAGQSGKGRKDPTDPASALSVILSTDGDFEER